MAKKKKSKKVHPGSKSRVRTKAGQAGGEGPMDLGDVGLGEAPPESDPKGRADYFLQMLDAFAQQGTQEAKRVRSGLIQAIGEYREATEDKELGEVEKTEAQTRLKAKLYGMEAGVMELLIRSVSRMRDRILEQARTLGTKAGPGKNAHTAAEGLGQVVEALQTMMDAANKGSEDLREKANGMMEKARGIFAELGS